MREFAKGSPTTDVARADEPYRRAMHLIYSRLSATAKRLGHEITHLPPLDANAKPYATPKELLAELDILIESLFSHGAVYLARSTQAPLAQSAERLHGKEKVYGSIPYWGSTRSQPLRPRR